MFYYTWKERNINKYPKLFLENIYLISSYSFVFYTCTQKGLPLPLFPEHRETNSRILYNHMSHVNIFPIIGISPNLTLEE